MAFHTSWAWWLLIVAILVTGYVQDVGTWFERISGLKRAENLSVYRFLLRGLPWPLFRYGGFLRLALVVAILIFWGWRVVLVSVIGMFLVSFAISRVSRRHAETMLVQTAADDFGGTHRLCSGCGVVWPLSYFALDAAGRAGHVTTCVVCHQPDLRSKVDDLRRQFAKNE